MQPLATSRSPNSSRRASRSSIESTSGTLNRQGHAHVCTVPHTSSHTVLPPRGLQGSQADQTAETDMHAEYARQRQHLEHSVAALRKKLAKDTEIHRLDNIRVMQVQYTIVRRYLRTSLTH